ncbi:MAG TPA: GNAT family N-acetyltransferase [Thermoplasmata archaeon]|nr:GNAT family N-acetyltransferase [Thermoplasmata archaeon]
MPTRAPRTRRRTSDRSDPVVRVGPLRRARLADLPTLINHRLAMYRDMGGFSAEEIRAHAGPFRRWFRDEFRQGDLVGFLLRDAHGGAVASGLVWFHPDHPRPAHPAKSAYLLSIYTAPRFRGRGFASRIVRAAVAEARRRRVARVALHASPAGRRVYRRLGFTRSWEMRLRLTPRPRAARRARAAGTARPPRPTTGSAAVTA